MFDMRSSGVNESSECSCGHNSARQYNAEMYDPPGEQSVLQHFAGPEHRRIGDEAFGNLPTTVVYDEKGTTLTVGEMIAIAGDYFEDYFQMKELARTAKGRLVLKCALAKATDQPCNLPKNYESISTEVEDEYRRLAGKNVTHFSAGGTAWATYLKWHTAAMVHAFDAGNESDPKAWREAISKEAFAFHFLTDSFSSGHVRTPRIEMEEWYAAKYPDAMVRLIAMFGSFMYDQLRKRNTKLNIVGAIPVLGFLPRYFVQKSARGNVQPTLRKFSLDDLLADAIHDYDGDNGLDVVSQLDSTGKAVRGGHHWTAYGDGKLFAPAIPVQAKPGHPPFDFRKSEETRKMVKAAVKASMNELQVIRQAGRKNGGRKVVDRVALMKKALNIPPGLWNKFAAGGYIPKEDRTSTRNTKLTPGGPLEWRWGQLSTIAYSTVDQLVKTRYAGHFARAASLQDDKVKFKGVTIGGVKASINAFSLLLKSDGITIMEKLVGKAR